MVFLLLSPPVSQREKEMALLQFAPDMSEKAKVNETTMKPDTMAAVCFY
jgi:hypothetical protein